MHWALRLPTRIITHCKGSCTGCCTVHASWPLSLGAAVSQRLQSSAQHPSIAQQAPRALAGQAHSWAVAGGSTDIDLIRKGVHSESITGVLQLARRPSSLRSEPSCGRAGDLNLLAAAPAAGGARIGKAIVKQCQRQLWRRAAPAASELCPKWPRAGADVDGGRSRRYELCALVKTLAPFPIARAYTSILT